MLFMPYLCRLGPLALAYATVGMLLASVGSVAGLGQAQLRDIGAAILLLVGGLVISGADRPTEAWLLDQMPAWLNELSVIF